MTTNNLPATKHWKTCLYCLKTCSFICWGDWQVRGKQPIALGSGTLQQCSHGTGTGIPVESWAAKIPPVTFVGTGFTGFPRDGRRGTGWYSARDFVRESFKPVASNACNFFIWYPFSTKIISCEREFNLLFIFESFCDQCDFRKGYEGFEACTLEVRIVVAILACILNQAYLV